MASDRQAKKPMTPAKRKAVERKNKRLLGAVPIEVWCHPDDKERVKATAKNGLKKRGITLTSD